MSHWESAGKTDEWYTPSYVFEAMGVNFDLDPCHPEAGHSITPTETFYFANGLENPWFGFVWMNPPFGKRNGVIPWLERFFDHGDGVALVPDRTSAPWCQSALRRCDAALFVDGKIKFLGADGKPGKSPSNGTVLLAAGRQGVEALRSASKTLGFLVDKSAAKGPSEAIPGTPVTFYEMPPTDEHGDFEGKIWVIWPSGYHRERVPVKQARANLGGDSEFCWCETGLPKRLGVPVLPDSETGDRQ